MQPVVWDGEGVIRFQENPIIRYLLDEATAKGLDINFLHRQSKGQRWEKSDWEQFAQLIGYSVSGFGDLSYVTDETFNKAATEVALLKEQFPMDPKV